MSDRVSIGSTTLIERLRAFEGRQVGPPETGADAVNQPMIRHWVEAVGDENPVYTDPEAAARSVHGGIVAPPVMLQAWVMRGVKPRPRAGGNAQDELMVLLDDAGFTSVVATNCEQEYVRTRSRPRWAPATSSPLASSTATSTASWWAPCGSAS